MELETVDGRKTEISPERLKILKNQVGGEVLAEGDADYDETRLVWNGMIDKHPALIVRCCGTADVIHTVEFAQEHDALLAVRGGGHNVAGTAVCDGGVVIDLSMHKGVRVDPASRTVRAAGGVTIGELDRETQAFELAVPMGVVSETGVAGLTLGGGLGWLRRKYGLSSDNLISADVVTADGELIRADSQSHPDLYWALQGGGGNFGVVTSFEYRAHPVGPEVYFAVVLHSGAGARQGLRFYREWAAAAPDEITSFAILWHGPEIPEIPAEHHGAPMLALLAMYSGAPEEGEKALSSLRRFGSPVADLSGTMPYLEVQQFFDEDYPARLKRYYWKSRFLKELTDEGIDALVRLNEEAPSPESSIDVWQLGGASARRGAQETAFGDRSAPFMLGIEANWKDERTDQANIGWARQVHEAAQSFAAAGEYLNFPGFYEQAEHTIRETFGDNLDRISQIKKHYDPQNRFRLNANIPG
ncbi:MAG: FAD-binding oxidoreductase [Actinomycetota bacterium]